jgi:uncharacterized protein (TIGR03067 family)
MVRTGSGIAVIIAITSYSSFAQEAKGDPEGIQGKWEVVAAIYNGKQSANKDLLIWTITKSHFVYGSDKQDTYKLNPGTKPKQIDITVVPPKVGGNVDHAVLLGIYELKGDALRICIGHSGKDRPKDFEAGAGRNVFTLKRVKTE